MRAWSIGEVARLLGVKPHVIRYWESELPLLSPKKGLPGGAILGNEVRLLMRFRHLLYERSSRSRAPRSACGRSWAPCDPDIAARFARIRSDLIEALMTARGGRRARRESGDDDGLTATFANSIEAIGPGAPVRVLG